MGTSTIAAGSVSSDHSDSSSTKLLPSSRLLLSSVSLLSSELPPSLVLPPMVTTLGLIHGSCCHVDLPIRSGHHSFCSKSSFATFSGMPGIAAGIPSDCLTSWGTALVCDGSISISVMFSNTSGVRIFWLQ